jgi:hypothetical protein
VTEIIFFSFGSLADTNRRKRLIVYNYAIAAVQGGGAKGAVLAIRVRCVEPAFRQNVKSRYQTQLEIAL